MVTHSHKPWGPTLRMCLRNIRQIRLELNGEQTVGSGHRDSTELEKKGLG